MGFWGGPPITQMSESNVLEAEKESVEPESAAQAETASSVNGDGATTAEAVTSDPSPEGSDSALETAQQELKAALDRLATTEDRALRIQAEFENARKRLQREKEEVVRYAPFEPFKALLPVVDDLEKAIETSGVAQDVKEGLEQIHQKLFDVFERFGLRPVDQHETFDPHLHEALARAPAEEGQSDQQILEVWRKGYLYKDRLMRASWVKVAVKE